MTRVCYVEGTRLQLRASNAQVKKRPKATNTDPVKVIIKRTLDD